MTVNKKFSEIAAAGANFTTSDSLLGVKSGALDVVYTGTELFAYGNIAITSPGTGTKMRMDGTGRVILNTVNGPQTAVGVTFLTNSPPLEVQGGNTAGGDWVQQVIVAYNGSDPGIQFHVTNATTPAGNAAPTSGDTLGVLYYSANDGTGQVTSAAIFCEIDGTPGVGSIPTKFTIATSPPSGGNFGYVSRLGINSVGFTRIVSGSFGRAAPVTKTGDFTVATNENWLINNKAGSSCTVTLPAPASFSGREIMFLNYQAQTVISLSANVVPIVGGAATTAILAATAGKWATLVSDGVNWLIMAAN